MQCSPNEKRGKGKQSPVVSEKW